MNAKEIVDKFKEILLSKTEEVKEVELKEETVATELAETQEEVLAEEEIAPAEVAEDVAEVEEEIYATKEELAGAIAQMTAMYDQIMESMSTEESKDVPAELTEEVVSEELSSQEEVTPISHSPEEVVSKQEGLQFSKNKRKTTLDLVLSKISK